MAKGPPPGPPVRPKGPPRPSGALKTGGSTTTSQLAPVRLLGGKRLCVLRRNVSTVGCTPKRAPVPIQQALKAAKPKILPSKAKAAPRCLEQKRKSGSSRDEVVSIDSDDADKKATPTAWKRIFNVEGDPEHRSYVISADPLRGNGPDIGRRQLLDGDQLFIPASRISRDRVVRSIVTLMPTITPDTTCVALPFSSTTAAKGYANVPPGSANQKRMHDGIGESTEHHPNCRVGTVVGQVPPCYSAKRHSIKS